MTFISIEDNDLTDIDYEHLDDLPLEEHIEWNHFQNEQFDVTDGQDFDSEDWLTA